MTTPTIHSTPPPEHPLVTAAGVLLGVSPTRATQQAAAAVAGEQFSLMGATSHEH
jgi:hypothetical protein